jgi:hypothetical protein
MRIVNPLRLFLFAGCLLLAGKGRSQPSDRPAYEGFQSEYATYHWTTSNGLPQSHISGIAQTQNKLLWIATYNGVVSYDGRRFMRVETGRHANLSTFVTAIHTSGDTVIWATPQETVWYCDRRIRSVIPVGAPNVFIMGIRTYGSKTYFLAHDRILFRSGKKLVPLVLLSSEKRLSGYSILTAAFSGNKLVLLLHDGSGKSAFYVYDYTTKQRTLIPVEEQYDNLAVNTGRLIAQSGKRWTVLNDRMLPGKTVHELTATTAEGRLQSGVENGCFYYYSRSGLVISCDNERPAVLNTSRSMYGEELFASFRDHAGNLWLGTNSLGLFLFRKYPFTLFSFLDDGPVTNSSHAFMDDEGLLWYDNNCTVTVAHDLKTNRIVHRIPNLCSWTNADWPNDSIALFAYGTQHHWYNKRTRSLTPMAGISEPVLNYLRLSPRHFILAGEGRLYHWYGKELKPWKKFRSPKTTCNKLLQVGADEYYFATTEGLYHFRKGKWRHMTGGDVAGKPDFRALHLLKGGRHLLIGTDGSGILRYDTKTGRFERLRNIPLPILSCWTIIEDRFGQLWITSNNGIVQLFVDDLTDCFDGKREHLTLNHYRHDNGIDNVEFNSRTQNKGRLLPNGDILFSSLGGPVIVHPQPNKRITAALGNLLIDRVRINQKLQAAPIRKLVLREGDFVQLQFTLASFSSERVLGFEYRVKGSRNRWSPAPGRMITLDNLPAGKYVLQIRTIAGERELALPVVVKSRNPWMWAFVLFTALAAGLAIVFITREFTKRAQQKKHALQDLKQQLKLLETEALRSQMNPHFIFNCLNTIQFLFISGNVARANKYLTNFSALMRMTLDLLREPIITLDMELKATNYYVELEQLQFDEGFEFRLIDHLHTPVNQIRVPSLFFQIFVENAILHGLKKTTAPRPILTLILEETPEAYIFRVCDNGPGISEQEHEDHTSIGIRLLRERFALKSEIYNWPMDFTIRENESIENDIKTEIIITFGKVLLASDHEYSHRR